MSIIEICRAAVFASLAIVLGLLDFSLGFQGGSVSFQMVPIVYLSLKHGPAEGALCGLTCGLVKLLFARAPEIVHPLQALLDFPVAFASLGAAGFLRANPLLAGAAACLSRFSIHLVSGLFFFTNIAKLGFGFGFLASLEYNLSYMLPSTIITLSVIGLLKSRQMLVRG